MDTTTGAEALQRIPASVGPGAGRLALAVGAMVLLAVLDLVGAVLARHWADHRNVVALVGGALVFALLFAVYASSLGVAELTTVTFGWIVLLQVGVVLLDRYRHGVPIGTDRLVVMVAIVGLQCYLLLAPAPAAR